MSQIQQTKTKLKKLLESRSKAEKRSAKMYEKALEDNFSDITLERWLQAWDAEIEIGEEISVTELALCDLKHEASKEIKSIESRLAELSSEYKKLYSKKERLYNDIWF